VTGRGEWLVKTGDWKEDKCILILLTVTSTYFNLRAHFDGLHSIWHSQVTAETLVGMIGEKEHGSSIIDPSKRRRGANAGALTTAATQGWARLGAEAQSSRCASSYSISVAKKLRSLICNYCSQSIHTGVAAFDYTPAPIETFPNPTIPQTWPFVSHSELMVSSAIPRFLCDIFNLFPAEFSSPLEGYEGVTAQCHNCGNWSAHCITRWCVPLPGPEQFDLTMRRPWFTVCFIVSDSTTLTTETATI
jgi:hypothetical protein